MSGHIPAAEVKKLFARCANRCAFPGCDQELTAEGEGANVGEMAHIVGEKRQGPRGDDPMPDEQRNLSSNLVLLCPTHHTIVDKEVKRFSIPVLKKIKEDHESKIEKLFPSKTESAPLNSIEWMPSSILEVTHFPYLVFSAETDYRHSNIKEFFNRIRERLPYNPDKKGDDIFPVALKDGRIYTFQDLTSLAGKLGDCYKARTVQRVTVSKLLQTGDGQRLLAQLLNSSIKSYASRLGVFFDKNHQRFFFPPNKDGTEKEISYRPPNARTTSRKVAYPPRFKHNGQEKGHWQHLAAGLKFHQFGKQSWGFSIRIERLITEDGSKPFDSKKIGAKVTKLKARMYNEGYLVELHFWREYLMQEQPRLILGFGAQSLIIGGEPVRVDLDWPGIPSDSKSYKNLEIEEDLFSWASLRDAEDSDDDTEEMPDCDD